MAAGTTVQAVTWGAEFWQSVLISVLGTLGSLLTAVLLFWLARWALKRDSAKEAAGKAAAVERERFRKAAAQLYARIGEFSVLLAEPVTPEWQQRYYDSVRRLLPVTTESLYQFRGTHLHDGIRELLDLFVELSERELEDAQSRMAGEPKDGPFIDVLRQHARLLSEKALSLHVDLLRAMEAIGRVDLS